MSKGRMVGKRSGDMETDFHGGKEMGWGGANWVGLITSVLSCILCLSRWPLAVRQNLTQGLMRLNYYLCYSLDALLFIFNKVVIHYVSYLNLKMVRKGGEACVSSLSCHHCQPDSPWNLFLVHCF